MAADGIGVRDILIGVSLGALAASFVLPAMAPAAQVPSAQTAQQSQVGRFQIVNGTPGMSRNIMLLDTSTGDSWITCSGEDSGNVWCVVPKTNSTTKAQ